jgi:hypothetical protein
MLAEARAQRGRLKAQAAWDQVLVGGYTGLPGVGRAPTTTHEVVVDTPDQIYHRGRGYVEKGEWAAALGAFDRVLWKDGTHAPALIDRAWLLATCPEAKYRDAPRALADAVRACELTGWKSPEYFEVIAAAYAEAGRFESAVEWQRAFLDRALYSAKIVDAARERLRLYEQKQPARIR